MGETQNGSGYGTDMSYRTDLRHGRTTTYQHHGCRCQACGQAQHDYMVKYRATEHGRKKMREVNSLAQRRARIAANWVRENRPDIWRMICEEYRNG